MNCKYCGKQTTRMNICSNCYEKRRLIRQIRQLGRQLQQKGASPSARGGR